LEAGRVAVTYVEERSNVKEKNIAGANIVDTIFVFSTAELYEPAKTDSLWTFGKGDAVYRCG
jgi:hypothetical protein